MSLLEEQAITSVFSQIQSDSCILEEETFYEVLKEAYNELHHNNTDDSFRLGLEGVARIDFDLSDQNEINSFVDLVIEKLAEAYEIALKEDYDDAYLAYIRFYSLTDIEVVLLGDQDDISTIDRKKYSSKYEDLFLTELDEEIKNSSLVGWNYDTFDLNTLKKYLYWKTNIISNIVDKECNDRCFIRLYCQELIDKTGRKNPMKIYNRLIELKSVYREKEIEGWQISDCIDVIQQQLLEFMIINHSVIPDGKEKLIECLEDTSEAKKAINKRWFINGEYEKCLDFIYESSDRKVDRNKYFYNDINLLDECLKKLLIILKSYLSDNSCDILHCWLGDYGKQDIYLSYDVRTRINEKDCFGLYNAIPVRIAKDGVFLKTYVNDGVLKYSRHIFSYPIWQIEKTLQIYMEGKTRLKPSLNSMRRELNILTGYCGFNKNGNNKYQLENYHKLIGLYETAEFEELIERVVISTLTNNNILKYEERKNSRLPSKSNVKSYNAILSTRTELEKSAQIKLRKMSQKEKLAEIVDLLKERYKNTEDKPTSVTQLILFNQDIPNINQLSKLIVYGIDENPEEYLKKEGLL